MADSNGFRHQDYASIPSADSFELICPSQMITFGSDEFNTCLSRAGDALRSNGVARIILVHGTLAGTDALGWYSHWQRVLPGITGKLKSTYKSVVDRLSGDRGNYTAAYAELLENSINESGQTPTQVERFEWTSENHHLGRADAAVRLAKLIIGLNLKQNERVLLWGHSHAGNVFALMTNLFGANRESRKRFFDAARHFHTDSGRIAVADWCWLENKLEEGGNRPHLDVVTFGTPVRYGWDRAGYDNLLHFVNHHPVEGVDPFRAFFPESPQQLVAAMQGQFGDLVQQTFVARSDWSPAIWSWTAWKANRMLRNLLESTELKQKPIKRLRLGKRVAENGKSLLVDYAAVDPTGNDICGHSVYTELDWMAFHMREVTRRFYANQPRIRGSS